MTNKYVFFYDDLYYPPLTGSTSPVTYLESFEATHVDFDPTLAGIDATTKKCCPTRS